MYLFINVFFKLPRAIISEKILKRKMGPVRVSRSVKRTPTRQQIANDCGSTKTLMFGGGKQKKGSRHLVKYFSLNINQFYLITAYILLIFFRMCPLHM